MIKVNETKILEMINNANLEGLKNYIMKEMTISAGSSEKKDGLKAFYKLAEKKFSVGKNYFGALYTDHQTFITNNFFVISCNKGIDELAGIKSSESVNTPNFLQLIDNYRVQAEQKNEVILNIPTLKIMLKTMKASKVPFNERIVIIEDTEGKKQVVNLEYLLMIDSVVNLQNEKIEQELEKVEKDQIYQDLMCLIESDPDMQNECMILISNNTKFIIDDIINDEDQECYFVKLTKIVKE